MGANHDDDMNDELNSYYTVRILSFLAISLW